MPQKFINVMYPTRNVVYGSKVYKRIVRKVDTKDYSTVGWTRTQKDALRALKEHIKTERSYQARFTLEQLQLVEEERQIQAEQRRLAERQKRLQERREAQRAEKLAQQEPIRAYMKDKRGYGSKGTLASAAGWKLVDSPEGVEFTTVNLIERRYTSTKKMKEHTYRLFREATKAFRIDFGFSLLLQDIETKEYRMFYNTSYKDVNGKVFEHPAIVTNEEDMDRAWASLEDGIERVILSLRHNTKWQFVRIVTYKIFIANTDINMGADVEIPEWIKTSKFIASMDKTTNNLCFWACLYFGFKGKEDESSGRRAPGVDIRFDKWKRGAVEFYKEFYGHNDIEKYKGVTLRKELPNIEMKFNVAIDIWEVDKTNPGRLIRYRRSDLPSKVSGFKMPSKKLNLLLITDAANRSHLCLIRDIKKFAGAYVCENCTKVYTELRRYNYHQSKESTCSPNCVLQLVGSPDKPPVAYVPRKTVIEKLDELSIRLPKWAAKGHYPYFLVWDTETFRESIAPKKRENINDDSVIDKTHLSGSHELMSISYGGNLYNRASHVNILSCGGPQEIVDKFVDGMMIERDDMVQRVYEDFRDTLSDLASKHKYADEHDRTKINKLQDDLIRYIEDVPIYGFNSSLYDTNVVKRYIWTSLARYKQNCDNGNSSRFEVEWLNWLKKDKGYKHLETQKKIVGGRERTDGYDAATNTVFEALGCFFHGCNKCFKSSEYNGKLNKTHGENYTQTIKRLESIKAKGFNVEYIWEHEWNELRKHVDCSVITDGIVKTNNKYRLFSNGRVQFRDINAFLAPGSTLSAVFKAFGVEEKGHFPHEFMENITDIRKVLTSEIPSIEKFHLSKKDAKDQISLDEYKKYLNTYKNLEELLEWYNNQDVEPLIHVVNKLSDLWIMKNTDIHKDGISLPSLVMRYIMKNSDKSFHLLRPGEEEFYHMLRDNVVGGPSIIFCHNHEKGKTRIRSDDGKICGGILGFDANALYLWATMQLMPTGEHTTYQEGHFTPEEMTGMIKRNEFFGVVEVDIHTPDHLKEKFSELAPIFKKAVIDHRALSPMDQQIFNTNPKASSSDEYAFEKGSKKLINSYFAEKMAIISPLLKWYVDHGLVISKVHRAISYDPSPCFKWFGDEVTAARSAADVDKSKVLIGDMNKLMGNSCYGFAMMDKSKHEKVEIVNLQEYHRKVNSPLYKSHEDLPDGSIELHRNKKYAKADLPLQMSFFVYGYAKLRILQFYHDFLIKYIPKEFFELLEMDTDSLYMGIVADISKYNDYNILDSMVRPELMDDYLKHKGEFLTLDDSQMRVPGLFKVEWKGDQMIGLRSKLYYCFSVQGKCKASHKGAQKAAFNAIAPTENEKLGVYRKALEGDSISVKNKGFRVMGNTMVSYSQERSAFKCANDKRYRLPGGVRTIPLSI